jgi:hypothetical protein
MADPPAVSWLTPRASARRTKDIPLSDWRTGLAPRLRPYLPIATPARRKIVHAADWLRHDRGVSKSQWTRLVSPWAADGQTSSLQGRGNDIKSPTGE